MKYWIELAILIAILLVTVSVAIIILSAPYG